jgi:putative oxidoreductase
MKNLLKSLKGLTGVLGRVMLCALFLTAVAGCAFPGLTSMAQSVAAQAAPTPKWALVGGVVLLVVGCLSVILGYRARLGASLLLALLVLTTYYFHGFNFWTLLSAQARQEQIFHLAASISMMGAMLFVIANGPGQMSLDAKRR